MTKNKTICVTGLRRHKLNWDKVHYNENSIILSDTIEKAVIPFINEGYNNFLCGMASGADLIFAKTILKLKISYPEIKLQAIIPFVNQEKTFYIDDEIEYNEIIEKCDVIRVLENEYSNDVYKNRNIYMINNSSILFAITFDEKLSKSGTTQTINLAKKNCLDVVLINSNSFETEVIYSENLRLF